MAKGNITTDVDGAYTFVREGSILKGMIQTEPGQGGLHYVRFFMPDQRDAMAVSFAAGMLLIERHIAGERF